MSRKEPRIQEYKVCEGDNCNERFPRLQPSGRWIQTHQWVKRRFCSRSCITRYRNLKHGGTPWELFQRHFQKNGPNECWPWTDKSQTPKGYGYFRIPGICNLAHQAAWYFANRKSSKGMVVRHKCDNPPCVNPAHLEIGTVADNNRDRDTRGRHVVLTRDTGNGQTKYTTAFIRQVLREYRSFPRGPSGNKILKGYVQPFLKKWGVAPDMVSDWHRAFPDSF